jgi:ADP-ribose pyrophosphatase YjhB (NUDIX family)
MEIESTEANKEKINSRGQVGIKVMIKNPDTRKFFLLRRNPTKYPEAVNQWTIPGGRQKNKDKTIKDVAIREVYE